LDFVAILHDFSCCFLVVVQVGTQSPEISRLTWVALEASFGIPSRSFETAQGWSNRQQPQGTAVGKRVEANRIFCPTDSKFGSWKMENSWKLRKFP